MPTNSRYLLLTPVTQSPKPGFSLGSVFSAAARLGLLLLLAASAFLTWRWLDGNLLHWGIEDEKVTRVNSTELIASLKAFEVVTVKHSYSVSAAVNIDKALAAGPARVALPGWIAGQEMRAKSEALVAAGVDLSNLTEDSLDVVREGNKVHVVIHVPKPELTSTELVVGTTDIDTSQGVLTRLRTRLGFNEKDLRDQAVDQLILTAKEAAVRNSILVEAQQETKLRLERFLNDISKVSGESITYEVVFDVPAKA